MMDVKISSSLEDYLEKIYEIIQKKNVCHAIDIANELEVRKPSVTSALKKLSKKGLVVYERYKTVELTELGKVVAAEILEKHNIIKSFFINVLEINPIEANELACRIEHLISDEVKIKLKEFDAFIKRCSKLNYEWVDEFERFCGDPSKIRCEDCLKQKEK